MTWDDNAAYLALSARDARFDGRLFVGVTSTGIYCRPVCRVRTPRRENCRFFSTRAQAEAQHFRPCLKCRPEIAPGLSHTDSSRALAGQAALMIERAVQAGLAPALPEIAERLGVTDRHLRRIFNDAHGVAPRDYIATLRLLLAKHLLSDTALPVTQIALASGFESLRRFNAAFLSRYRLSPTRLRQQQPGTAPRDAPLRLAYRPPYDVEAVVGFFAARTLAGVEQVDGLLLRRCLSRVHRGARIDGWIECRFVPERCEVHVRVDPALAPALGALLHDVRRWLDLDADVAPIDAVMTCLPVPARPGARLPGCMDGFETAVRVIVGQQVSVKAARTLVQRIVQRFGRPLQTPFPELSRLFPDAAVLAAASASDMGELGIVRQRVGAIQALAQAVLGGELQLHPGAPLQSTLDRLRALPGVGEWTAQLVALRVLAWPDAWPSGDIGLMTALGSRDRKLTDEQAQAWRPWRGYAVMRLWHQLENPT